MKPEQLRTALMSKDRDTIGAVLTGFLEEVKEFPVDYQWQDEARVWLAEALSTKNNLAINALVKTGLLDEASLSHVLLHACQVKREDIIESIRQTESLPKVSLVADNSSGFNAVHYGVFADNPDILNNILFRNGELSAEEISMAIEYASSQSKNAVPINWLTNVPTEELKHFSREDLLSLRPSIQKLLEVINADSSYSPSQLASFILTIASFDKQFQLSEELLPKLSEVLSPNYDFHEELVSLMTADTKLGFLKQHIDLMSFHFALPYLPEKIDNTDFFSGCLLSVLKGGVFAVDLAEKMLARSKVKFERFASEDASQIFDSCMQTNNLKILALLAKHAPNWVKKYAPKGSERFTAEMRKVINKPNLILNPNQLLKEIDTCQGIDPLLLDLKLLAGDQLDISKVISRGTGHRLLDNAIRNRNEPLIYLLLSLQADVNLADKNGVTPLMRAIEHNISSIVIGHMLAHNGDAEVKDKQGRSVKDRIKQERHSQYQGVVEDKDTFLKEGDVDFFLNSLQFDAYETALEPDVFRQHARRKPSDVINVFGETSLISAVNRNNVIAVKYLLTKHATHFTKDHKQVAFDLAMLLPDSTIAKIIDFKQYAEHRSTEKRSEIERHIASADSEAYQSIWGWWDRKYTGEEFLQAQQELINTAVHLLSADKKQLMQGLKKTQTFKYCFSETGYHAITLDSSIKDINETQGRRSLSRQEQEFNETVMEHCMVRVEALEAYYERLRAQAVPDAHYVSPPQGLGVDVPVKPTAPPPPIETLARAVRVVASIPSAPSAAEFNLLANHPHLRLATDELAHRVETQPHEAQARLVSLDTLPPVVPWHADQERSLPITPKGDAVPTAPSMESLYQHATAPTIPILQPVVPTTAVVPDPSVVDPTEKPTAPPLFSIAQELALVSPLVREAIDVPLDSPVEMARPEPEENTILAAEENLLIDLSPTVPTTAVQEARPTAAPQELVDIFDQLARDREAAELEKAKQAEAVAEAERIAAEKLAKEERQKARLQRQMSRLKRVGSCSTSRVLTTLSPQMDEPRSEKAAEPVKEKEKVKVLTSPTADEIKQQLLATLPSLEDLPELPSVPKHLPVREKVRNEPQADTGRVLVAL